jgi:hypothetical protein
LKAGNGYLYDVWIFFPGLAYGITDNFMVAGGASIIPGADDQLFYFMPKLSFKAAQEIDVAVSLNIFRLFGNTLFVGLGNMTFGTEDRSVTTGIGLAFTEDKMADNPVGTLGGECRLSRRMSLVGEAWYVPTNENDGIFGMGGFRLFGEKMAVDLGAMVVIEKKADDYNEFGEKQEDESNWLPYIDFIWNF